MTLAAGAARRLTETGAVVTTGTSMACGSGITTYVSKAFLARAGATLDRGLSDALAPARSSA